MSAVVVQAAITGVLLAVFGALIVAGLTARPQSRPHPPSLPRAAAGDTDRPRPAHPGAAGHPPWANATRPDDFWPGMLPARYDDPGLSLTARVALLYRDAERSASASLPAWCRDLAQEGTR